MKITKISFGSPEGNGILNNPAHRVRGMSRVQIDLRATDLLTRFFPEYLAAPGAVPVLDLIEFVLPRHFGVDYGVTRKLPPTVEAITLPSGSRAKPEILFREDVFEALCNDHRRYRFTAAHEAFHALQHVNQISARFINGEVPALLRRQQLPPYEDPEWQSNFFAGAFLLPTRAVQAHVELVGSDAGRLAEAFEVNRPVADIRLKYLRERGMIS